ncbi:Maternal protein tudor [Pseudolycoriella hygida]|uniref:Maternal protein tudor n=1 Tax=Pseudolycoriella hygida TaxID=35572 RepID=A0A9Q0N3T3_9DIPT|nr:Maternal protein tudor [Pseudolycoriella hygida]
MLNAGCMVLVYLNRKYFRGRFVGADAQENANIFLIDRGYTVTVELANIRILDLARKQSQLLLETPPQASEFILNRCIISHDALLSKIQDEIAQHLLPFHIDDEVGSIKRISLIYNGRDYADHLVNSQICQSITAEKQMKYLMPKPVVAPIARPINKLNNNDGTTIRSSINPLGIRNINNYLNAGNKVPQNMPSYQPKILPSMDFNSNRMQTSQPANSENNAIGSHLMPTFISDTLLLHGRHQVYVSYVEDGPYMFSVQLKSSEQRMEQMMVEIAKTQLQQLSKKPALGMACLARYSEDNRIYRAVIKSVYIDSCQMLFVDYGNSEKVLFNHIYDIPEQFLRLKTFAIRVSLAGLKQLPSVSDKVKSMFIDMVNDKEFDMLVVPPDGKAFVQYCELSLNGQNMLDRLKDMIFDIPKFIEPIALKDDDFVVIRYVDSPKLFCVQQTKNIKEYDAMMDRLCVYSMTAPTLQKIQNGVACAARYKNDSEWYRAEIVNLNDTKALIQFVDYGIEVTTEVGTLKEISNEFLAMPKQAVRCCLSGFEVIQTPSNSSQDQMELLAEDSIGERRNFRVKFFGNLHDTVLVNLIDESQVPHLDLSKRMLQLSLPQKSFRQYELRLQNKVPNSRPPNSSVVQSAVPNINASPIEKTFSDSGFHDSPSNSSWDTSKREQR